VSPWGPQVLWRVGMSRKPLSSRNTRWAPSFAHLFFYRWPLVPLPLFDGFFVSLDCPTFWNLATPPQTSKDFPHVTRMVLDAKLLLDHTSDSPQGPELVRESISQSSFQQNLQQLLTFPLLKFSWASRYWLGCKRSFATLRISLLPTEHRPDRCTDTSSNLRRVEAARQECDSLEPSSFQVLLGAVWSHGP
jgi:hypothetical protein